MCWVSVWNTYESVSPVHNMWKCFLPNSVMAIFTKYLWVSSTKKFQKRYFNTSKLDLRTTHFNKSESKMLNHEVMQKFGTCSMILTQNCFYVYISSNLTAFLNSLPPTRYKLTSWSKKLIKSKIKSPKLLCALTPLVAKILNRNISKTKKDIEKTLTDMRSVLKTPQNIKT